MSRSSWRASLRIARRDAWRAKGRSLLVLALIGLPVFALGVADVAYRTYQLGPSERIARELGSAQAAVRWLGGPVSQDPAAWLGPAGIGFQPATTSRPATTEQLLGDLPPGSRAIAYLSAFSDMQIHTSSGLKYAQQVGLDYTDPLAHGLVHQKSGRAPRNVHEVALTPSLAKSAGLGIGDVMHLINPTRDLTVVGLAADAAHNHAESGYTLPAAVPVQRASAFGYEQAWLIGSLKPITWAQVRQLNARGYAVLSRSVYLRPPPASEVPVQGVSYSASSNQAVASGALVGGMALLEIVLLAGPAFAVSARRQRRDLALIAATGGRRSDLRNVVLSNGIVLGLAAGVLGVVGAVVGAAIGVPTLGRYLDAVPGHFEVRALELSALLLVAVLTALAAAVFPARAAARTDVVAALAGRRGALRTPKRVVVVGLAVGTAGVVATLGGASASTSSTVILSGVALTELGLIICTPGLLGLVSRLGRRLPLAPRIALRDAGRNRSAAAPAVAAVMASLIGAVAVLLGVASSNDQSRRNYQLGLPINDAYVQLSPAQVRRAVDIAAALGATMPASQVVSVHGAPLGCDDKKSCSIRQAMLYRESSYVGSTRYNGSLFPQTIVDDGSGVTALFGQATPEAAAALRAGKAVVLDRSAVHDGKVSIVISSIDETQAPSVVTPGQDPATAPQPRISIPAVAVDRGFAAAELILPPSVAAHLGLVSPPVGVLAANTRAPSDHERQAANAALSKIDPTLFLSTESGYHDANGWMLYALIGVAGLIAVGAAVIATALANLDSRADLVTLGAIGASPRTRRVLSMSRAGIIAGIGAVLGCAAGFLPALAWIRSVQSSERAFTGPVFAGGTGAAPQGLRLVVPWPIIALALFGIPVIAAVIAGTFTRSRLPSERSGD
ncbi:MAG: hypothetical protein DLM58_19005 [Pseudonocardiales bacterium]|nr:MAG: hypothetical protein DLM58_19005 [Pseudonocardiales bacterium]